MKINSNKNNFFKGFRDKLSIVKIDKSSEVSQDLYFIGSNDLLRLRAKSIFSKEASTISWLDKLNKNDVLLDIGANIGLYTIYAATTRKCRVIAVEPESQNFSTLIKNIALNNAYEKITPYCCAMSNENRVGILHLSQINIDGGGSGHMFNEEVAFDLTPVPGQFVFKQGCVGITLDDAIKNGSFDVPNFIKIDVDGFEHKVIEGSLSTLQNPKVRSVLVEIYTKLKEHKEIINLLVSFGFKYDSNQAESDRKKEGWNKGMGNIIFNRDII